MKKPLGSYTYFWIILMSLRNSTFRILSASLYREIFLFTTIHIRMNVSKRKKKGQSRGSGFTCRCHVGKCIGTCDFITLIDKSNISQYVSLKIQFHFIFISYEILPLKDFCLIYEMQLRRFLKINEPSVVKIDKIGSECKFASKRTPC